MNKTEKLAVALLFVVLVGWGFVQRKFFPPATPPPDQTQVAASASTGATNAFGAATQELRRAHSAAQPEVAAATNLPTAATSTTTAATAPPPERGPEQTVDLVNNDVGVTVSTWGGGVTAAELMAYRASLEEDAGTVAFDFSERPALALDGIPGLSAESEFALTPETTGTSVVLRATSPTGLQLERRIALGEGFQLHVEDTFRNTTDSPLPLPRHHMALGPMESIQSRARTRGFAYLGVDTLSDQAGRDVMHWGKKAIPGFFGASGGPMGCGRGNAVGMPMAVQTNIGEAVSWAAAKNKFFVQILQPAGGATDCRIYAGRSTNAPSSFTLSEVSASIVFAEEAIEPGKTVTRVSNYYVGPKKYSALKSLSLKQSRVMQFGWWAWFRGVCAVLLTTLNAIHAVIPNYGIAIILLTIIVKILFWPLTHKSTESAKKMKEIQPLVAELREKHKDEPQKLQKAQMALYKEHGVNPMASCLPMLVQLPIFIALFTVLRSAVELRFASFLWIQDLSEPEELLAGTLPIPLNILPILMTLTMVLQQRLTPTGGDPQQQKMMMFMPMIMLIFFYNMPSALVLYWTVSQSLSIAQLLHQKRGKADADEK